MGERWGAGWCGRCDGGGRVVVEAALFGCVEDELVGGVVDVGGALQEAGAGDAEAVQGVLGGAGEFAGLEGEGWFAWSRAGRGWAGVAVGVGGGSGGGEDVAGCVDGGGCLAGFSGGFGGGCGGVLALEPPFGAASGLWKDGWVAGQVKRSGAGDRAS